MPKYIFKITGHETITADTEDEAWTLLEAGYNDYEMAELLRTVEE